MPSTVAHDATDCSARSRQKHSLFLSLSLFRSLPLCVSLVLGTLNPETLNPETVNPKPYPNLEALNPTSKALQS